MSEKDVQVFVNGTLNYFSEISGDKPDVGLPYIKKEDEEAILTYTGAIGISGERKGCVYFTCDRGLLDVIVETVLGPDQSSDEAVKDMVGEIANTIAGNARQTLGSQFMISVPIVIVGKSDIKLPTRIPTFVVPVHVKGQKGFLVVGLE